MEGFKIFHKLLLVIINYYVNFVAASHGKIQLYMYVITQTR